MIDDCWMDDTEFCEIAKRFITQDESVTGEKRSQCDADVTYHASCPGSF